MRFTGTSPSFLIHDVYGLQAMKQYLNDSSFTFRNCSSDEAIQV
jgi:hypothetical protein